MKITWGVLGLLLLTNSIHFYTFKKFENQTEFLNQELIPLITYSERMLTAVMGLEEGFRGYLLDPKTTLLTPDYTRGDRIDRNDEKITSSIGNFPELKKEYNTTLRPLIANLQNRFAELSENPTLTEAEWYKTREMMNNYRTEHREWTESIQKELDAVSYDIKRSGRESSIMFGISLLISFAYFIMMIIFYNNSQQKVNSLSKLVNKDFLTGLGNRRYLDEKVKRLFKKNQPFELILFDIDFFKQFNDTYGHKKGDYCLKVISKEIKKMCKDKGYSARVGGEEFAIILPYYSTEESKKFAEQLRTNIQQLNIEHSYSPFQTVTISIGVTSVAPPTKEKFAYYYNLADKALYKSKETGRNKTSVWNCSEVTSEVRLSPI
jgi:diguanylate cyclase (GGDEF)-like protein